MASPDALHLAADAVHRYQYDRPCPTMPLDLHYAIDIDILGDRGIVGNVAMRSPDPFDRPEVRKAMFEAVNKKWREEHPDEYERWMAERKAAAPAEREALERWLTELGLRRRDGAWRIG